MLTGWKYPENESLEELIQKKGLYPVNILKTKKNVIDKMLNEGIVLIKEIEESVLKKINISESIIRNLLKQKEEILKRYEE